MRLLQDRARAGGFRLVVFGHVDPRFRGRVAGLAGIEIRRHFDPAALDSILDEVDVGLMPSIWEEAYGYAGSSSSPRGSP